MKLPKPFLAGAVAEAGVGSSIFKSIPSDIGSDFAAAPLGRSSRQIPAHMPPLAASFVRARIAYIQLRTDGEVVVSNTIVCISCVKSKRTSPCAAKDMYTSPLFRGMLLYAQQLRPQMIFILSAEYGLLKPDDMISPYEKTLKTMKTLERSVWAGNVLSTLRQEADLQEDRFIFLAGAPYRENLVRHIRHYEVPMEGLSFGRQLQWLNERVSA